MKDSPAGISSVLRCRSSILAHTLIFTPAAWTTSSPHHEGEIAQSEGYTGEQVVNIWTHGQHLLADGVKMAKSMGNSFILSDIEAQGINPLAFRYLCLTARYDRRLNFTFTSLKAAQRALLRLRNMVWQWSFQANGSSVDTEVVAQWQDRFKSLVDDNLNMPGALALTWELAHSDESPSVKLELLSYFDGVLGLDITNVLDDYAVPSEVVNEISHRLRASWATGLRPCRLDTRKPR